jgi:hypothetical protein
VSLFDRFSGLSGIPGMDAQPQQRQVAPGQPRPQPQPPGQAPRHEPEQASPAENSGWDDFSGSSGSVEAPPQVEDPGYAPAQEAGWEVGAAVDRASAAVEAASWQVATRPDASRYSGAIERMHRGIEEARARGTAGRGIAAVRQITDAVEADAAALLAATKPSGNGDVT